MFSRMINWETAGQTSLGRFLKTWVDKASRLQRWLPTGHAFIVAILFAAFVWYARDFVYGLSRRRKLLRNVLHMTASG
jgi:hypothetical protein